MFSAYYCCTTMIFMTMLVLFHVMVIFFIHAYRSDIDLKRVSELTMASSAVHEVQPNKKRTAQQKCKDELAAIGAELFSSRDEESTDEFDIADSVLQKQDDLNESDTVINERTNVTETQEITAPNPKKIKICDSKKKPKNSIMPVLLVSKKGISSNNSSKSMK